MSWIGLRRANEWIEGRQTTQPSAVQEAAATTRLGVVNGCVMKSVDVDVHK